MGITAVVITKDDEEYIRRCITGVAFCNEVIIIVDSLINETSEIIQKLKGGVYGSKLKIINRPLNNNFAKQRNFGLKKAKNGWVLFVDSDEIVDSNLGKEIVYAVKSKKYKGYYLMRRDYIWNTKLNYGDPGRVKLLRLAKRESGEWVRSVHEYWDVKGRKGVLRNPLLHYPHQTLREFVKKIDYYSEIHAEANLNVGKKASLFKIFFYPFFKFIDNYFLKLGFFDGIPGLLSAAMMSFHSYLSWSKLWLKRNRI